MILNAIFVILGFLVELKSKCVLFNTTLEIIK